MAVASERFWEDLLLFIEDGKVIPVVGPELVTVADGEQQIPLYRWLARRLADRIEVPEAALPPDYQLNDVVSHYLRDGGEREGLYSRILKLLRDGKPQPSQPLRDLASIPAFDLFVTLTFDSLLAEALTQARHGAAPRQMAYSTQTVADLAGGERSVPVVYHLLGLASSSPEYAICDEDLLEFLHALQDRQRQPLKLFDELRSHHLLFLGCGFGDWLTRFFLRTARGLELSQKRKRWDVLVDARSGQEPALAAFLSSFSIDTKVLPMPAAEFVAELARRWREAHPEAAGSAAAAADAGSSSGDTAPREGAVFVSYAAEDLQAASVLAEGLRAAGLEVWFDKKSLEVAGDWALAIERGIERCSLFLPVISQAALAEENRRRYFWREWNAASERARGMAPDEEFIVPVVVDETRLDRTNLPDTFTRKQGPSLPGGRLTPEVGQRLTEIVRNFHRRQRRA
ncbi:TIR protein [Rubrivivax sp. A210]|uniref:toll/interleukin-1 receptor domain-containing protein n=1 Tax=Rubrivivax sp. A210 TaxID=2772301 RepID=UPI001917A796|nr:toll/interleukin-1 receptor domain-containing protein [Rubrivivax sp. A210]CAD5373817.1 TIR protein [Rubrivivax sp. A210]